MANLGIGIEDAYASANEMELALEKEKQNKEPKSKPDPAKDREVYEDTVRTSGTELEDVCTTSPIPNDLQTKDAPQEMVDNILGKKKNNGTEIGKKLVALNTKVMAIANTSEGSKLKKEYEKILEDHGEENCPESLLKLVKESFYAASQRLN